MKPLTLFTLLLFSMVLPPHAAIKLEIGAKLDRRYVPRRITQEVITNASQTRPFIERDVRGVKYIIAFDSRTREIKYIHTKDSRFRTAGGLRVGGKIPLKREQLEINPYWEIRAPKTSDGWYPVVGVDHDGFQLGFDMVSLFKGNERRMVSIDGFSKGGN